MLFNLFAPLADDFGPLNLFRYLTFRTGGAVLTALLVSFIFGPLVIRWLRAKQGNGQPIRDDGPERHIVAKAGTPTMGGFLILLALTVSTLLWADITSGYVWVVLLVTLGFGGVGFADDYLKVMEPLSGVPVRLRELHLRIFLLGRTPAGMGLERILFRSAGERALPKFRRGQVRSAPAHPVKFPRSLGRL